MSSQFPGSDVYQGIGNPSLKRPDTYGVCTYEGVEFVQSWRFIDRSSPTIKPDVRHDRC